MFYLGVLYDSGDGVSQDYAKAREWFEKAADKGSATAAQTSRDEARRSFQPVRGPEGKKPAAPDQ